MPVLVEKAFTATLAGAREVVAAARERGVFCMEAMWTRLQPAVVRGPAARRGRRDRRGARRPGRPRRPPRLRPRLPALRPRARRRRDPRPRGLPHLLRPGLPRHPRPRGRLRDALPQRHRRVGDDAPGVRRRARRLAGLRRSPPRAPGRAVIWGTGGSIELPPRFHHPTSLVVRRNGQEAETARAAGARAAATATRSRRSGAAWPPASPSRPVVPLDDTLGVQWVMEEALSQLGITTAEAVVDLGRES